MCVCVHNIFVGTEVLLSIAWLLSEFKLWHTTAVGWTVRACVCVRAVVSFDCCCLWVCAWLLHTILQKINSINKNLHLNILFIRKLFFLVRFNSHLILYLNQKQRECYYFYEILMLSFPLSSNTLYYAQDIY